MLVAASASRLDTLAESALGIRRSRKAGQELAVLEINGDVIGILGKQLFEILYGRGGIALGGAFHGQPIARERVLRMGCQEFLEQGTARFLHGLCHGVSEVPAVKGLGNAYYNRL